MPVHLNSFLEGNQTELLTEILTTDLQTVEDAFATEDKKKIQTVKYIIDKKTGERIGKTVFTMKVNDSDIQILDTDIVFTNHIPYKLKFLEKLDESSEANEYYNVEDQESRVHFQIETVNHYRVNKDMSRDEIIDIVMNMKNPEQGELANGLIPFNVQPFNMFKLAYHHDLMSSAGLWGFKDEKENVIVSPKYLFEPIEINGLYIVCIGTGWEHKAEYIEGRIWSEEQKWGVIDSKQNIIIPFEYDEIEFLWNDEDDVLENTYFRVYKHQYKPYDIQEAAIFNHKGEIILPFMYNDLDYDIIDKQIQVYKNGTKEDNDGYTGIYDIELNKEIIKPNKYKTIEVLKRNLFLRSQDRDYGENATLFNEKEEIIGEENMWEIVYKSHNKEFEFQGKYMTGEKIFFNIKNNQIVDVKRIETDEEWMKY